MSKKKLASSSSFSIVQGSSVWPCAFLSTTNQRDKFGWCTITTIIVLEVYTASSFGLVPLFCDVFYWTHSLSLSLSPGVRSIQQRSGGYVYGERSKVFFSSFAGSIEVVLCLARCIQYGALDEIGQQQLLRQKLEKLHIAKLVVWGWKKRRAVSATKRGVVCTSSLLRFGHVGCSPMSMRIASNGNRLGTRSIGKRRLVDWTHRGGQTFTLCDIFRRRRRKWIIWKRKLKIIAFHKWMKM